MGAVALGNCVQRVRVLCKFAHDNGSIDRPVRYGQSFKTPSRKTVRIDRAKKGAKPFTVEEVRTLIDGVLVAGEGGPELVRPSVAMRAMMLLSTLSEHVSG